MPYSLVTLCISFPTALPLAAVSSQAVVLLVLGVLRPTRAVLPSGTLLPQVVRRLHSSLVTQVSTQMVSPPTLKHCPLFHHSYPLPHFSLQSTFSLSHTHRGFLSPSLNKRSIWAETLYFPFLIIAQCLLHVSTHLTQINTLCELNYPMLNVNCISI